jgi:glycosyltransferase involved in cell wall biosynthesis
LVDVFEGVVKQKNHLLLIVGDGVELQKLKAKSNKLQANVKFETWTNDPISYLKTADCLLFPSRSEGYGLVAMEASAVGTPIIMNSVGVANYELKPSEKVKILPINDKEKWIKAILEI